MARAQWTGTGMCPGQGSGYRYGYVARSGMGMWPGLVWVCGQVWYGYVARCGMGMWPGVVWACGQVWSQVGVFLSRVLGSDAWGLVGKVRNVKNIDKSLSISAYVAIV